MTCEDFLPFIDAYVDSEFDTLESEEMDEHLSACPSCRKRVDAQMNWKRSFRECLSEEAAPEVLRSRILEQLQFEHIASESSLPIDEILRSDISTNVNTDIISLDEKRHNESREKETTRLAKSAFILLPLAAVALLSVFTIPQFMTVAPASSDTQPIVEQAIDWHRGNYPIEVTGPEANRVAGWFQDKVKFPVHLPELQRASLLGGRIANIKNQRAAYILYDINGSKLSVMLFDGKGLRVPKSQIKQIKGRDIAIAGDKGYHVALLQEQGITYAITSDLPQEKFNTILASFSSNEVQ